MFLRSVYFCVHVKPVWEIVNNVILPGKFISHDMVMFGYETDSVINHLISVIVYFIYREWLVCSFENIQQQHQLSLHKINCKLFDYKEKCILKMFSQNVGRYV